MIECQRRYERIVFLLSTRCTLVAHYRECVLVENGNNFILVIWLLQCQCIARLRVSYTRFCMAIVIHDYTLLYRVIHGYERLCVVIDGYA